MRRTKFSPVTILGSLLLASIVITIIVLFTFYGNGQYTANICIR